jgi:hypothetical protein
MITHEQAKELKEAGFPQTRTLAFPYPNYYNQDGLIRNPARSCTEDWSLMIKIPILSELIEACGGDSVIVLTIGKSLSTALHGKTGLISQGKTPEEAVKNLYIALNKK